MGRQKLAIAALFAALAYQAMAQDAPPAQESPAIRATVNEVALDFTVRDKKGHLIKNLKPGDVEIYEDGVKQDVRSFRLVSGETAPPTPPASPAASEAETHPSPLTLSTTNLLCIVFHNLPPGTRKWGVDAARAFIQSQLRPGMYVGVFNLDSRLVPLLPFTTNRDQLLAAANKAFNGTGSDITRAADAVLNSTPNLQLYEGFTSGHSGGVTDMSTTGSVSPTAIVGADVDNSAAGNAQRGDLVLQREQFIGVETARQMDQIKTLIRQMATFPGHKTVLLLSSGFTSNGEPDQFQAMLNKANLADLTVYAFDANGLSETSTTQSSTMALQHVTALSQQQGQVIAGQTAATAITNTSTGTGGALMERSRQGDYQFDAVRTSDSQSSLRALAEGTGGALIANTNDLRKPFQQIADDVETHYEADYHPASNRYDGHFRKIEIKLAHADWKIESRTGYFAIPDLGEPLQPFEMAALMTLNSRPLPHAFDFHSSVFQFRPGNSAQNAVVFELPGKALAATPESQKKHRVHVSLFAVAKDTNGQIVDHYGHDFPYDVPDDKLSGIQAAPIDYTHTFNLPPGHYTVESVLIDREARRASTSSVEFDSQSQKGVGLSSIVLVGRVDPLTGDPDMTDPLQYQDREIVPLSGDSLQASAKPLIYFLVYPDKWNQEKPRVRVQLFVGGEELEQKQTDLPAPDTTGAIPVLATLAAKPGKCEIKVTASQGFQSVTQTIAYTVVAQ